MNSLYSFKNGCDGCSYGYYIWKDSFVPVDGYYPILKFEKHDLFSFIRDLSPYHFYVKSYKKFFTDQIYRNISFLFSTKVMLRKNVMIHIAANSILGLYNLTSNITNINLGKYLDRPSHITNISAERYDIFALSTVNYSNLDKIKIKSSKHSNRITLSYNYSDITIFVSEEKAIKSKFLDENYTKNLGIPIFLYINSLKNLGAKIEIVPDSYLNQFISLRDGVEFTSITDALKTEKEILSSVQDKFEYTKREHSNILIPFDIC